MIKSVGIILTAENWISEQALKEEIYDYKTVDYKIIIIRGGLVKTRTIRKHKTYADFAAAYLRNNGLNSTNIKSLPTPESGRFLSAVIVRDWLQKQNIKIKKINLYSQGVHARRTKALYEMAFGDQYKIGINAGKTTEYKLGNWWKSSTAAKAVITETIGLIWVKCCFYPGGYQSHQEKWGIYERE